MSPKHLAYGAASLAAVAVAYGPLLVEFGRDLWEKPHYQHYPFVLLAAVLLFVQRLASAPARGSGAPAWLPYAAFGFSWGLLGLAYLAFSPLLAALSLVVLLGGWGVSLSRRLDRPFPLAPWLLLLLVVPPPLGFDQRLMQELQQLSSRLSSYTLDLLGQNHLMDGNALVLPDKELFVDEACSGIISVISIVACAAMYGVWRRRGGVHTVLLMVLAAGWATLLNVVRITSIAVAWSNAGVDWSEGVSHTTLGLGIFGLSLITLVATDWLLNAALAEIGPRWDQITGEPLRFGSWVVTVWDHLVGKPTASAPPQGGDWRRLGLGAAALSLGLAPTIAFAGLGAAQLLYLRESPLQVVRYFDSDQYAGALQQEVMPENLCALRLVGSEYTKRSSQSQFGEHSVIFEYEGGQGDRYLTSCDFPFGRAWHPLVQCYSGIGWRIEDREIVSADDGAFEVTQATMTKPDGRSALITYAGCYADGTPGTPPGVTLADKIARAFTRRSETSTWRQSIQVQVLVERPDGITDLDRSQSLELLEEARRRFVETALSLQ